MLIVRSEVTQVRSVSFCKQVNTEYESGSRIRIKRHDRSELRSDLIKRILFETRLVSHDCELCMSIKIPLRVHASPKYHTPGATEVKLKYKEGLSCGTTGNAPRRVALHWRPPERGSGATHRR